MRSSTSHGQYAYPAHTGSVPSGAMAPPQAVAVKQGTAMPQSRARLRRARMYSSPPAAPMNSRVVATVSSHRAEECWNSLSSCAAMIGPPSLKYNPSSCPAMCAYRSRVRSRKSGSMQRTS